MTTSAIRYIEARAAMLRAKADQPGEAWALARHDATLLEALASDLRAGLHEIPDNCEGAGRANNPASEG